MATPTTLPTPTIVLIPMPQPYMRGACLARCSVAMLSRTFPTLKAGREYIAGLVVSGKAIAVVA